MLDNLLRLSFDTHANFLSYAEANSRMLGEIWRWHEDLGNQEASIKIPGVCDMCTCQTTYCVTTHRSLGPFEFQAPWWTGLICGCGMDALGRAIFSAFLDGGSREDRIYHVGHHSPFARWLQDRAPNVVTSQYAPDRASGEVVDGIRYESLTGLSFSDGEFDCVIASEILEHIPDYKTALREMARVLRSGGRTLLTFPWLGGKHYDHITRAEMRPDGSIHHILPPEYHGDPANHGGVLSFRSFGWNILDEMRAAGFTRAEARFLFGPLHGHMTLLHPVIVGTH
jgi:SAM-dependent methyltransferase